MLRWVDEGTVGLFVQYWVFVVDEVFVNDLETRNIKSRKEMFENGKRNLAPDSAP